MSDVDNKDSGKMFKVLAVEAYCIMIGRLLH